MVIAVVVVLVLVASSVVVSSVLSLSPQSAVQAPRQ